MSKDIIINSTQQGVEIALLEDQTLVELHQESPNNKYAVGDIYLGTVRRTVTGLNAAFIDVGYEKDAFLHYTDLGPQIRSLNKFVLSAIADESTTHYLDGFEMEPPIIKTGNVTEVLNKRQKLLVQVLKEPISSKGPRLSCEISLPGRYSVLTPFDSTLSVSKKIKDVEERKRLQTIGTSIKPSNFGLIIRTAAEGKSLEDLQEDIGRLMLHWERISTGLEGAYPPQKVYSELDKTSSLLRDLLNASFTKVIVNDKNLTQEVKEYIQKIAPTRVNIVEYYKSKSPIFDHYNITKQIKSSFGKTVNMQSGAYLVVEHTQALHVVDVNSGNKPSNKDQSQETNALTVNLEAAAEIARQLRLRDLGGIIVIDFIDMKKTENKKMVYDRIRDCMRDDKARHTILPFSKFCLMQITRQRVKPALEISTTEICPTCSGSGKVHSAILLVDEIKKNFHYLSNELGFDNLKLTTHPFIAAYLKKGFPSERLRWCWDFKKWLPVMENEEFSLMQYQFVDAQGDDIKL